MELIDEACTFDELIMVLILLFHGVGFRLNYASIIAKSLRFVKRLEKRGNDVIIIVMKDEKAPVVGRAEYKLDGALRAFGATGLFRGKTILDIGSSTGGFTECALRFGAEKVVAVEKGSRQMKAPLCFDPRVELHEKTDIFDFWPEKKPDIIVADVSFVSLAKVLGYAQDVLARQDTEFFVMLKPQFESAPRQLKNGVVKNNKMRREIIARFEQWLKANRFLVVAKRDNELAGRFGNVERFYWLRLAK